jgi:hypothetical protein
MLKELLTGVVQLGAKVRSLVINEIVNWNPLRNDNVDNKLDVVAYAMKMIEGYGHLMEFDGSLQEQEIAGAVVMEVSDNCSF